MRMLAGRTNVTRDDVSFNYQLNDKRVKLAVVVREAKSDENNKDENIQSFILRSAEYFYLKPSLKA